LFSQIQNKDKEKEKKLNDEFPTYNNNKNNLSGRNRSFSMVSSFNEFLEKNKKINSMKIAKNSQRQSNFNNLIEEIEINISKPITIKDLLQKKYEDNIDNDNDDKNTNKDNKNQINSFKVKNKTIGNITKTKRKLSKTIINMEDKCDKDDNYILNDSIDVKEFEKMINRRITQSIKIPKKNKHILNNDYINNSINNLHNENDIIKIQLEEEEGKNFNFNNKTNNINIYIKNNNNTKDKERLYNSNLNQFQKSENNFKNIFNEDVIINNNNNDKLQHRNSKDKNKIK